MRMRKFLRQKNELLVQWNQITNPKLPILILDGIQYRRTLDQSNFWQRIIGKHFTLSE